VGLEISREDTTTIVRSLDATAPVASVAWTVMEYDPVEVGVPLITPLPALSVNTAGRVPLVTDHENGAVPPVIVSVCENGARTAPWGRLDVKMTGVGLIVMLKSFVAVAGVPAESVTLTVNVEMPLPVGVPLKTPAADRVIPAGILPDETAQV
jgi:hypothetical protein